MLASLTDAEAVTGYALPSFTAAKISIGDVDLLGLPDELELDLEGIALTINRGGAVTKGTTRTAVAGSKAWIDWAASFEGDDETPAGLDVETGSGTAYLDLRDPVLGVSADAVTITIDAFVSIRGSFAFQQGGLVDLAVRTPSLTADQIGRLAGDVTGATAVDGGLLVTGVTTTAIGIGGANVYVGYAAGGFDDDGAPVDPAEFYGLEATGIDFGLVVAKVVPSGLAVTHTLPSFVGFAATLDELGFVGIPKDLVEIGLYDLTFGYNSARPVTGPGLVGALAFADWSASTSSSDPDGAAGGIVVATDGVGGSVLLDHDNAMVGVSAERAVLGFGDFVRISGSFSFQRGALEEVTAGVSGLNLGQYEALQLATVNNDVTVTGNVVGPEVSRVRIHDLLVRTTLIGLDDAGVFVGYNPGGFDDDEAVDCAALDADLDARGAFGLCLDDISLGLVLAQALPNQIGALGAPKYTALRANLGVFDAAVNLLGLPDFSEWLTLQLKGLELTVNRGKLTAAPLSATWIDWADSFPGTGGGPVGLPVPTGGEDVLIDFASPVVGVSADYARLTISDFVHVSGGFAFRAGGLEEVDVDVRGLTGLTQLRDVEVKTTTFGISNGSVFVGYAPGGIDLGEDDEETAEREDLLLTEDELGEDATGLLLVDVDLGIVFATPTKPYPLGITKLPTFMALNAHVGDFVPVGLELSFVELQLHDLGLLLNRGGPASGTGINGQATIDWGGSFDGGYLIPTSTTDAEPMRIDVRGPVVGLSAGRAVVSLSDFVHVSGGFSFIKGETLSVDINLNAGVLGAAAISTILTASSTACTATPTGPCCSRCRWTPSRSASATPRSSWATTRPTGRPSTWVRTTRTPWTSTRASCWAVRTCRTTPSACSPATSTSASCCRRSCRTSGSTCSARCPAS